jgi:two-component system OmpR family response regulator
MTILVIEDDVEAADLMCRGLEDHGYQTTHAADGRTGLQSALQDQWDLIIADRMLPHVDGLSIVQAVREQKRITPILILSALANVDDRVRGLRAGGDDYLTKPFAFVELLARVEALLRRGPRAEQSATRLQVNDLELDLLQRQARRAGQDIELTSREFDLLAYLMRHSGQVVTRSLLLENVWDLHFDPQTNVIDVHMSRIRQAIDKKFSPPLIHTVRGAGYVLGERSSDERS